MNDIKNTYQLATQFQKLAQERIKGKSLPESGYEYRKVRIYRATSIDNQYFHSMDYITLSEKFAKEHAEHSLVVSEESQHVISALVYSKDVYEAYNPGEYFYDGPEIKGRTIYLARYEI